MSPDEGIHPDVGRQTPAAGAHIFLGQPNIFFVTVNAKDAVPWMANETVQKSLVELWSKEATAWRVGYYLIMPDHLHFFCAPYDLHFGIDQWIEFWKRQFSRRHLDQLWAWQRKSFHHRMRDRIECEEKLAYVQGESVAEGNRFKVGGLAFSRTDSRHQVDNGLNGWEAFHLRPKLIVPV